MTIAPQTTGVHHLALRAADLARAHAFYGQTLGFPIVLETWESFVALAGATVLVVHGPGSRTPAGDRFDPFRVGLDHIALGCPSEAELERVAAALGAAGVASTGIRFDVVLRRRYVAFKDPDGIAWELYMAPNLSVEIVERCLDALRTGRLDEVPFADHVTFDSPMAGRVSGRTAVIDALRASLPPIVDLVVRDHLVDRDIVVTRFDLATAAGRIEVLDRLVVVDGLIAEIRLFYDPRSIAPLLAPQLD
jgi:catechol 2,3-dioxygenase-like lactoylglutathione lyase family enzyme